MGTSEEFRLQDRDVAILSGLFESRIMTNAHLADIYFSGRREAAKKRLQKLKVSGYISERTRLVNEPAVLHLSRLGLAALAELGFLNDYPPFGLSALERRSRVSELTLNHELEVMDVKASFHAAVRNETTLSIAEFTTWPALCQFEASTGVTVKPDGFIRIQEKQNTGAVAEHTFFLEVDRSTEAQETLVSRGSYYLDYYRSGGFAERNGAARSAFKAHPFRVLMVFKSAERRNIMAERLLQLSQPILSQVWLSTFEEVKENPFGPIWIRPIDYRIAVNGTAHDVNCQQFKWAYRRQTSRDLFIEDRVIKQRILGDLSISAHRAWLLLYSYGKPDFSELHDGRSNGAAGHGERAAQK